MSGYTGLFGLHNNWITNSISLPFTKYRNVERIIASASSFNSSLDNRTQFNTVLCIHHGDIPLLIHAGGEKMDQIILTEIQYCDDIDSPILCPASFILPINQRVLNLCGILESPGETSSIVLALTKNALIYLRTRSTAAHLANKSPGKGNNIILEPIQEYSLSDQIVSLSTSPSGHPCAVLLTANGQVIRWSLFSGLENTQVLGIMNIPDVGNKEFPFMNIQSSIHPQIHFISAITSLYRKDLRCPGNANALFTSVTPIVSMSQINTYNGINENHIFVSSTDGTIDLLDIRHSSRALGTRQIASEQTMFLRTSHGENFVQHGNKSDVDINIGLPGAYFLYFETTGF